jgi:hypothetical protein
MNNNGSKPTYIDPKLPGTAVALDEAPDEALTAQALDSIRGAERLSGFGRFATKMQNLFQTSGRSDGKRESSHLKAAPIMMSVGLLLLLATGLLFLLSKPEGAVHTRFRQPTGLSGVDDRKHTPAPNTDPGVTENQLVGGDTKPAEQVKPGAASTGGREAAVAARFSFADEGAGASPTTANQTITNELQTPATVFVASPGPNPATTPTPIAQRSRSGEMQLPAGTEIVAHTTNAISSGLESPVIAVVDRSVQLGDGVVIPQGARVIGYTAGAVKDRINVRFTSLLLPNNREVAISGLALMKDGSAGLVGRVQGSGHPVLAGAARVATGASALAIQFAGQNNQPFSQADYLRNQLAAQVVSEGSRYSGRLQQPVSVPIVTVGTNQSIRIFLLNSLTVSGGTVRDSKPAQQAESAIAGTTEQNLPPEQALAAAQTAYIQALEAQLADMRAALDGRKANGRR